MRFRLTPLALGLALVLLPGLTVASPITYIFTGTVNQDFTGNPLGTVFADGQSANGYLIIDSGTPDADPGNPESGTYLNAILEFVINVGSYTAMALGGGGHVDVADLSGGPDALFYGSAVNAGIYDGNATLTGAPIAGLSLGILGLSLSDVSGTALGSDALPASLILGNWSSGYGYLGFQAIPGGAEYSVSFNLESLEEVAPIPEPGTMLLLGSGLASLSVFRRRTSRRAPRS